MTSFTPGARSPDGPPRRAAEPRCESARVTMLTGLEPHLGGSREMLLAFARKTAAEHDDPVLASSSSRTSSTRPNPTAVPPELATDLDGHPRKTGATVDIGAYEVPEPAAGASALAALLALAARALFGRGGAAHSGRSLVR